MTKNSIVCDQCGGQIEIKPRAYRIVAIRREGAGYGRAASWPNVYVHATCLNAWHEANGNKTPAAQPALS